MKVGLGCPCCKGGIEFYSDNINNGFYTFTCNKGHHCVVVISTLKFEMLFAHGLYAMLDGYYGEAVTRFAVSLERFFEISIRVFLLKKNISVENIDNCWKLMGSQSERQKGAYYSLYLAKQGRLPNKILPDRKKYQLVKNEEWETFRNRIIHKGYIPIEKESLAYGESVYNYILSELNLLKLNFDKELNSIVCLKQKNNFAKGKKIFGREDVICSSVSPGDIFQMNCIGESDMTFDKAIALVQREKRDEAKKPHNGFYMVTRK